MDACICYPRVAVVVVYKLINRTYWGLAFLAHVAGVVGVSKSTKR